MRESFDNLLRQYEDGKLTRRQVLGAITALAGPTSVLVPDPDGVIVQLSSPTERFEGTPPNRGC